MSTQTSTAEAKKPHTSSCSKKLEQLPPLANAIIDKAIDNVTRKLVAGYRNKENSSKKDSSHNAEANDLGVVTKDTLTAASATSAMEVANRGVAWKEMFQKTLSHGVSSIATMKFDGSFTVKNGKAEGLDNVPNSPGVYVIFNQQGESVYIGDSKKLKDRWHKHQNDHRQGQRNDKPYKLADEFQEGCTVNFILMESEATAAAVEAHILATAMPKRNSKEELKDDQQGTRANIEAKKMKDASGNSKSIAQGAAIEATKNVGWGVFEQLATELTKALKDELVEIAKGISRSIKHRLQRIFNRVWKVIRAIIDAPMKILAGIFEFVVNAVSKTIAQFYNLAKNIYDLGLSAWQLFQGAETMSTDELVQKVTETLVLSGTLILWDALDPILEANLATVVGPVAPYLSAAICAVGYGISSFYLQRFVPALVKLLIAMKSDAQEAVEEMRLTCERLIAVQERELILLEDLRDYVESSFDFEGDTRTHIKSLASHQSVEALDVRACLAAHNGR